MPDPKGPVAQPPDIGELLAELAIKIERVKQLYEQYFMGIEKLEPLVARKEVTRALLLLQQQQIRNTGVRFKFNTMLQKWNIYITYWNRTLREIDAGTYVKHLAKARRAAEREGKEMPIELVLRKRGSSGELPQQPVEAPSILPPKPRSGPPPIPGSHAPPTGAPPPPSRASPPPVPGSAAAGPRTTPVPAANIPGMSEAELRALHKKYVDARAQAGEGGNVSYQSLVNSLAKQVPKVLEQPGVRGVRFDVAVQNGKAVLKAFPQK
ncbi:MAG TPA: MXAN_5187 C-terminal domain-containing protein [Polyangia bacterium]|nr:MXAN_5187 C-terminal domain-containing protein [Polyangia bacterium]